MLAIIAYAIGLCNKSVTLEDFAHVEIIALFVVARQRQNTTEIFISIKLVAMETHTMW